MSSDSSRHCHSRSSAAELPFRGHVARISVYLLIAAAMAASHAGAQESLRRIREIPLPHVEGRIDHMDVDVVGHRLLVAALGNHSVEVVDLIQGKVIRSIVGQDEPQGIRYLSKFDRIVVANGGDGSLRIFGGRTYEEGQRIRLGDDADNVRYVPASNRLYVGYGSGAIGVIDASTFQVRGAIALTGHPESFQCEPGSSRIFVNVPEGGRVEVLDGEEGKRISSIVLEDESGNYPMALDEDRHLLLVGCRKPPRLLVIDAGSLQILSRIDIDGDADDLFYDRNNGRIYASCGSGYLDVIERNDSSGYAVASRIKTASGARTSFFAPELHQLFLAVPRRGDQRAEVWVYEVVP